MRLPSTPFSGPAVGAASRLSCGWRVSGLLWLLAGAAQAQTPTVTGLSPTRNAPAAPRATNVAVSFSQPLSTSTATQQALRVFSQQAGGKKAGTATVSGNTLTFDPSQDFKPGETVFATLTAAAQSSGGQSLAAPQVFQFTAATAPAPGTFSGGSDPVVGLNPYELAVGDVDGDGDLDFVTANNSSNTVSVRLNNGAGTFGGGSEVAVGIRPFSVVLGDVDGDGDLDLLNVNYSSSTVSLRLNNGSGSFAGGQEVAVGAFPTRVVLGDVDGDGDLDLLTNSLSGTVSVRLNNGAGTFAGTQQVPAGPSLAGFVLGDVDQDGDLDLLAITDYNTVSVRLNDGAGSFSGGSDVTVSSNGTRDLTTGDVDNDGDLDLVVTTANGAVNVRLNNGSGSFSPGPSLVIGTASSSLGRLTLGDVDGDGDLDLLTTNSIYVASTATSTATVSVRRNNGAGTFSGSQEVAAGLYVNSLALGDVDGDGDLDLLMANDTQFNPSPTGGTVSVRLNLAAPTLTSLAPATGSPGSSVVITGTSLLNATSVTFNGVAATSFTVNSATQITARVPAGGTSGPVVVTTSAGASNSLRFTVLPALTITSLTPPRNARSVPRTTTVAVGFSQPLSNSPATQQALKVFSQQAGGRKAGTGTVSGNTLTFTPAGGFKPGETVFATLTSAAQSSTGTGVFPQVFQFTTATAPAPGTFNGGSDPAVGPNPYNVATGDVDSDGDLDLVTANNNSNTVSVRLNNGSGSFSGSQEVSVGQDPTDVALGDVDGDGDLDLLTANSYYNASSVSVRLNNGSGMFSGTQEVLMDQGGTIAVALGDVDADGDLDLVAATGFANVSVRLNNGDGRFSDGQNVRLGGYPRSVALGDVDGDGDLDLVTSDGVRLNNGSGVFGGAQQAGIGGEALGDVDGDGDLDLLAATGYSRVNVRLNNGDGRFSGGGEVLGGGSPVDVALGDVDGDGDLDLVAANAPLIGGSNGTVSVRLNNGSGTFTGVQEVAVGTRLFSVAVGDVDGDGDLDLLTANAGSSTVSVRLNQNQGLPTLTSLSPVAGGAGSSVVLTGTNFLGATGVSFNGVAATSFVVNSATQITATAPAGVSTGPVVVTTLIGSSNSLLFTVEPLLLITALSPARNAVAAPRTTPVSVSFNQAVSGGAASLAALRVFSAQAGGRKAGAASSSGNTLTFAPAGGFKPGETVFATLTTAAQSLAGQPLPKPQVFQFTTATAPGPGTFSGGSEVAVGLRAQSVATGDVDGDGDLDLVTANYNSLALATASVRLNNGQGTFSGGQEIAVGRGPFQVVLGDVDGDGDLDLLTADANSGGFGSVSVRLNNGDGTFGGLSLVSVGDRPHALALGDVDGDGDLDLVAANFTNGELSYYSTGGTVSVRLNDGSGRFGPGQEVPVGTNPFSVVLGDVDADGDLDLVTASSNGSTASVRLNDGSGSFNGTQEVAVGFRPQSLALGDVDKDGDLDLVTTNYYDYTNPAGLYTSSTASVRLNNGQGTFSGSQTIALGQGALTLALGDVDGDGDLDLLATTELSNSVSLRLNNGSGSFAGGQQVSVGSAPYGLALGDVDGDGDLDLLTANPGSSTVSVRVNQATAPTTALYRLNAGSEALSTTRGLFAADQYYSPASRPFATAAPIAGTSDPALYQTERYSTNGLLSYALPVPNGSYSVVLHFAEIYWTQVGQRIFDVRLEGSKVLDHYDIVRKVGPLTATTETFPVTVTDGVLNLDLSVPYASGGVDQAKVSAIEVLPAVTGSRAVLASSSPIGAAQELSVYPNPSHGRFTLRCTATKTQPATLSLTDGLGRIVQQQQQVQLQAGANTFSVQAPPLAEGLYQLTLRSADGQRLSQKVFIQP